MNLANSSPSFLPDGDHGKGVSAGPLSPDLVNLFEDLLNAGTNLKMRVTGNSMKPFLQGNEVVTVRKVSAASLKLGDLILVRQKNGTALLHRLVRKGRDAAGRLTLQTRGDALLAPDPPTPEHQFLGKVFLIEKLRDRSVCRTIDLASRPWQTINRCLAAVGLLWQALCALRCAIGTIWKFPRRSKRFPG
jgi:hypothetical protein